MFILFFYFFLFFLLVQDATDLFFSDKVLFERSLNQELHTSSSNTRYEIHNPANNVTVATVPETTEEEFNAAVASCKTAFEDWKEVSVQQRARVMMNYQQLLKDNKDEIAKIITEENGKTIPDSHGDLQRGLEVVEHCISMPTLIQGDFVENVTKHTDLFRFRAPLGVTATICPFNFPAMIPLWSLPVAM